MGIVIGQQNNQTIVDSLIAKYKFLKENGAIKVVGDDQTKLISVYKSRFDPETGKSLDPTFLSVDARQLSSRIDVAQEQVATIQSILEDAAVSVDIQPQPIQVLP